MCLMIEHLGMHINTCCIGKPGSEVIKLYTCLARLSTNGILLKNVKMPKSVDILTFISIIHTTSESIKARITHSF